MYLDETKVLEALSYKLRRPTGATILGELISLVDGGVISKESSRVLKVAQNLAVRHICKQVQRLRFEHSQSAVFLGYALVVCDLLGHQSL